MTVTPRQVWAIVLVAVVAAFLAQCSGLAFGRDTYTVSNEFQPNAADGKDTLIFGDTDGTNWANYTYNYGTTINYWCYYENGDFYGRIYTYYQMLYYFDISDIASTTTLVSATLRFRYGNFVPGVIAPETCRWWHTR